MKTQKYRAFAVTGLELEYPVIGPDGAIRRLVPGLLADIVGEPASDAELEGAGLSNEFVDHVVELKNPVPLARLSEIESELYRGVLATMERLEQRFGASLVPVAMHPWMKPTEAGRWQGEGTEIYETYARLFPTEQQGWVNVQSCHVNLPFGSEKNCCAMMNATALLVPYLPAVTAASPFLEGKVTGALDQRLVELVDLQGRVPESKGSIVPEYLHSFRDYRTSVLEPMFAAVDRLPDAGILREDFFNSRGAVLKFGRTSMELRILDVQECVRMDVAMAALVRATLRGLMRAIQEGSLALPDHGALCQDYRATIRKGRSARVNAPHLPGAKTAGGVMVAYARLAEDAATPDERAYLPLALARLETGCLAERLKKRIKVAVGGKIARAALRDLLDELREGLRHNQVFET